MSSVKGDLDVILEFLEEHNKQQYGNRNCLICENHIFGNNCQEWCDGSETAATLSFPFPEGHTEQDNKLFYSEHVKWPEDSKDTPFTSSFPADMKITCYSSEKRKKIRLFQFLFEMLEDSRMASFISWVKPSAGIFQFSAQNKDELARIWGQFKGNKKVMNYQKLSRALRTYSRTGEITKEIRHVKEWERLDLEFVEDRWYWVKYILLRVQNIFIPI